MPYIIDGHNLIPHLPGLSLQDLDDEIGLIQVLGKFANLGRTKIEVYFDHAPAGQSRSINRGLVKAVFVRKSSTADNAIKARLSQLGKESKNWTVVSSDREILAEARSIQSRVLTAPEFAELLRKGQSQKRFEGEKTEDPDQANLEIDYWLEQFSQD
ncbi:MAG: NYN domain-containing protein [Anaerolineales bacterium]